jgi:hypothetical protein
MQSNGEDEARELKSKGSFTGYAGGNRSRVDSEQSVKEMEGVGCWMRRVGRGSRVGNQGMRNLNYSCLQTGDRKEEA